MYHCRMKAYEGSLPYLFISYSHADSDLVLPILDELADRGYRIWYDDGITVGSEWPEFIAEHLAGSALVVAFVTSNSVASSNCRREVNFAISEDKPFAGVFLSETQMSPGMKMQFASQQCLPKYSMSDETFYRKLCAIPAIAPCKGSEASTSAGSIPGYSNSPAPGAGYMNSSAASGAAYSNSSAASSAAYPNSSSASGAAHSNPSAFTGSNHSAVLQKSGSGNQEPRKNMTPVLIAAAAGIAVVLIVIFAVLPNMNSGSKSSSETLASTESIQEASGEEQTLVSGETSPTGSSGTVAVQSSEPGISITGASEPDTSIEETSEPETSLPETSEPDASSAGELIQLENGSYIVKINGEYTHYFIYDSGMVTTRELNGEIMDEFAFVYDDVNGTYTDDTAAVYSVSCDEAGNLCLISDSLILTLFPIDPEEVPVPSQAPEEGPVSAQTPDSFISSFVTGEPMAFVTLDDGTTAYITVPEPFSAPDRNNTGINVSENYYITSWTYVADADNAENGIGYGVNLSSSLGWTNDDLYAAADQCFQNEDYLGTDAMLTLSEPRTCTYNGIEYVYRYYGTLINGEYHTKIYLAADDGVHNITVVLNYWTYTESLYNSALDLFDEMLKGITVSVPASISGTDIFGGTNR